MNEKKNVYLRKMLNLEVLSNQEQSLVTGGESAAAEVDHCSCPCPVTLHDISGYVSWDAV